MNSRPGGGVKNCVIILGCIKYVDQKILKLVVSHSLVTLISFVPRPCCLAKEILAFKKKLIRKVLGQDRRIKQELPWYIIFLT